MGTGLELLLLACWCAKIEAVPGRGVLGLELRLGLRGVPGGVTPLPFALDSPIAFTRSFTDTPISSDGKSLPATLAALQNTKLVVVLMRNVNFGLQFEVRSWGWHSWWRAPDINDGRRGLSPEPLIQCTKATRTDLWFGGNLWFHSWISIVGFILN